MPPSAWTTLAHLLRPQGRKGEVLAELPHRLSRPFPHQPPRLPRQTRFRRTPAEAREIRILNHWMPTGRNHGRVVLAFESIDSISLAETLEGLEVIIPLDERTELEDDAEYIDDLLDCTVYDGADAIGQVTAVDFPHHTRRRPPPARSRPAPHPAHPAGDEVLIPYVQAFIVSISTETKRIEMKLPPGLLEINRGAAPELEPEPDEDEEA